MYQECNNEATTTIPFTVSVELKKEEIDCLSNLEEQVNKRDLYLEREKVLNMNE